MEYSSNGAEPSNSQGGDLGSGEDQRPSGGLYDPFSQMGVGKLWRATWRGFLLGFKAFLAAALGYAAWIASAHVIFLRLLPSGMEPSLVRFLETLAAPLVYGIPGILLSLVLTVAADRLTEAQPVGIAQAIDEAFSSRRFRRYLLASTLYLLILSLGGLLLLIPAIIWWIRYLFASCAVVVEGLSARQSLSRSGGLVKGRWFRVFFKHFGAMLLCGLLILLPVALLTQLTEYLIGHGLLGMEEVFGPSDESLAGFDKPAWMLFFDTFSSVMGGTAPYTVMVMLLFKSLREEPLLSEG